MEAHPRSINTADVLHGIEAELKRCLDLLGRIEDEVLPIVTNAMQPSLRAALQDIDLLSQCIDDISRCVHGVALQKLSHVDIDAHSVLAKIRLQDMRIRLEGGSYDARKLTTREELFDPPAPTKTPSHQLF